MYELEVEESRELPSDGDLGSLYGGGERNSKRLCADDVASELQRFMYADTGEQPGCMGCLNYLLNIFL